ncbi:patatin-like phospholipase family protein [Klenkia terrae]|uniref:patatin-like phospholipase family protein n=1 Tax=Klenkia terrae TaxID=1052259 RepID=UPI00361A48CE
MSGGRTALVLGGGGITGIAWEIGVVTGLGDAGVDLRTADLVVGTSAGSVVGAQLRSAASREELYRAQLGPSVETGPPAAMGRGTLLRFGLAMLRHRRDEQAFRARLGALATAAAAAGRTPTEEARRAAITARLPSTEWPREPLTITAVDAATGAFETFTRDSGVDLVSAVAASCAVPGVYPPITVGGRRFVDGGVRSVANVDLAAGYDRVVVLAPITRGIGPMTGVDEQVGGLGAGWSSSARTPGPRPRSARTCWTRPRGPSAQAGRAQAEAVADQVREVWTG